MATCAQNGADPSSSSGESSVTHRTSGSANVSSSMSGSPKSAHQVGQGFVQLTVYRARAQP